MSKLNSHRELTAYQKSYQLCIDIYMATKNFPKEEQFGLKIQMRRAAVSAPSNIAEGHMRKNRKEYVQFLRIALSSLAELDTQVSLSRDLEFLDKATGERIMESVVSTSQVLHKLIRSLE